MAVIGVTLNRPAVEEFRKVEEAVASLARVRTQAGAKLRIKSFESIKEYTAFHFAVVVHEALFVSDPRLVTEENFGLECKHALDSFLS
jgi:hypothetical protein